MPFDDLAKRRARPLLVQKLVADSPTPAHDGAGRAEGAAPAPGWLLAGGPAREEADCTLYRRDMLAHIQAQGIAETGAAYAGVLGTRYAPASNGPIEGVYREPVQLISGKFAVIKNARNFRLVPLAAGTGPRIGQRRARHDARRSISWTLGRARGQSITLPLREGVFGRV